MWVGNKGLLIFLEGVLREFVFEGGSGDISSFSSSCSLLFPVCVASDSEETRWKLVEELPSL